MEECSVCVKIVDGRKDALFCEGFCKGWFHRYCVGVSVAHFKELSSLEVPFRCVACFQKSKEVEIADLKNIVSLLQEEVAQLRESMLDGIRSSTNRRSRVQENHFDRGVNAATSRGVGRGGGTGHDTNGGSGGGGRVGGGRRRGGGGRGGGVGGGGGVGVGGGGGGRTGNSKPNSVKVKGARKVWGTLRNTTSAVILNSIKMLTNQPATSELTVKRKYKSSRSDSRISKWWFVVQGDEIVLDQLEKAWASVTLQTAWRLEPVYSYVAIECSNAAYSPPALITSIESADLASSIHVNNGVDNSTLDGGQLASQDDNNAVSNHNVSTPFLEQ